MDHPSKRDQRRALFFRRWLSWVLITILVLCVIGLASMQPSCWASCDCILS